MSTSGSPCGPVYETILDVRVGIRWYDDRGRLVKRLVSRDMEGTWSLSPAGTGPLVSLSGHGGWGEVYATPGDLSSADGMSHGTEQVAAPGYGVIAHIAGRDHDEEFHGIFLAPAPVTRGVPPMDIGFRVTRGPLSNSHRGIALDGGAEPARCLASLLSLTVYRFSP